MVNLFHRENKKPKDLKRAIGKLDKDDWNIKNIDYHGPSTILKH